MTRLLRLIRMLAIFTACVSAAHGQNTNQSAMGYVGWWQPSGWRTVSDIPFKRLHFFEIAVTDTGSLGERHGWPDQWTELQAHAAAKKIPIDVTITMMDAHAFHRVFSSPSSTTKLMEQLVEVASHPAVAGIHLDVEMYGQLDANDISAYRDFVQGLVRRLGDLNPAKSTSVFLPFQSKSFLYDRASLQGLSHVVVQGYDSHWLESKNAGPIAPLDGPYALTWKKAVAYADIMGIPRTLQFMGYPLYGYEWRVAGTVSPRATTQGKGVITTFAPQIAEATSGGSVNNTVMERVTKNGATFDPITASSFYVFKTEQGQRWEGWFEDWWGLQRKTSYASQEQLGGLAFFLLGYDNGMLVDRYHQLISAHSPSQ